MWETVETLMEDKGLKIADVARGAGVPYSCLTDWKTGRSTPKSDKRQKIARFLGVSLQYLDTGKPEDESLYLIRTLIERRAVRDLVEIAAYCDDETLDIVTSLLQRLRANNA